MGIFELWSNKWISVFLSGTKSQAKERQAKGSQGGLQRLRSVDRAHYENSLYAGDDEENIVFEDFARARMSETED